MRITTSVVCVLTLTVGAARAEKYDCSLWPDVSNDTSVTEINCRVPESTIPSELGDLSRLTTLRLERYSAKGYLRGPIPSELGRLSLLANLDLYFNELTGSIPSELASMSSLRNLDLDQNKLTGSIPSELASMSSLTDLDLGYNRLTGTIPSELASMSLLARLDLRSNRLTGSIPSELASMSSLTNLDLDQNKLTGSIPSELASMSSWTDLDLGYNRLTGTIPSELASMSSLTNLDLGYNRLTGTIPSELGNSSSLRNLRLGNNKLRGSIPSELASMSSLRNLDLDHNKLTGSIPSNINITTFRISDNYLTGCIDDNYIDEVYGDDDFQNQLCSKLPACSSGSRCTRANSEYDCNLWPNIPRADQLDELQPIVNINCSGMGLGQSIPSEIGSLTRLTSLNLSNNNLQGSIPELSRLRRLLSIDLHSNRLVGETPSFSFSKLEKLDLYDNQLCIRRDLYNRCVNPGLFDPIEYCDFGTQEVCTSSPAGTPNDEPNIILILGLIGLSLIGITLVGFFVLKLQKKNNNQEQALDNESGKNAVSALEIQD